MWLWLKIKHRDFFNKIFYFENHTPPPPKKKPTESSKHSKVFQINWIGEVYIKDHKDLMNNFVPIKKTNKNMENL